jgi:acyl-coenzyme A thioesterase PaaI-like protein
MTTLQEPTPDLLGLSGLEQLRATLLRDGAPFGRLLGMEVEELEVGRAVFSLVPGERHYNPIGR